MADIKLYPYLIQIYCYISIWRSMTYILDTDIKTIIKFLGLGGNRNYDKYVDKIKKHLEYLQNNEYIYLSKDINLNNIGINQRLIVYVSEDKTHPEFYTCLYVAEYNRISSYCRSSKNDKNLKGMSIGLLLQILCYIRFRITKRSENQVLHYGKEKIPETFYHYFKDIGLEIGTSSSSISLARNILMDELQILYCKVFKKRQADNGNWYTSMVIFTNYYEPDEKNHIYGWKKEIEWSEKLLLKNQNEN